MRPSKLSTSYISMELTIAVLPGDGIGPEVIAQGVKVLTAIADKYGHKFRLEFADIGGIAIDHVGEPLPDKTLQTCVESDAVLLGAIGSPKYADHSLKVRPEQGLLALRKRLNLFTNIRPIKAYEQLFSLSPLKEDRLKGTDFVIYRELTGGIYFGKKGRDEKTSSAYDLCSYTQHEIERVAKAAFKSAFARKKKLTLVDKANVLESSRLWREVVDEMKADYPDVSVDYLYVDKAAMQIILAPNQFDVILCSNLFGDILSDEASVIGGSLGLLPSASIGGDNCLFEPVHGSYPQAAGKDIANPIATILSVSMLLAHFELYDEAEKVEEAVEYCMSHQVLTEDLNPNLSYSCSQFGDFVEAIILEEDINLSFLEQGSSTII